MIREKYYNKCFGISEFALNSDKFTNENMKEHALHLNWMRSFNFVRKNEI